MIGSILLAVFLLILLFGFRDWGTGPFYGAGPYWGGGGLGLILVIIVVLMALGHL